MQIEPDLLLTITERLFVMGNGRLLRADSDGVWVEKGDILRIDEAGFIELNDDIYWSTDPKDLIMWHNILTDIINPEAEFYEFVEMN